MSRSRKPRILFMLSGSIACYKACEVISKLVQEGNEVQVAASSSALRFVGEATLEGLSGRSVFSDIFASDKNMQHIELSRWADLAILCPASAHCINGLAQGLASDPINSLFLAFPLKKKPFLLAPAMNHQMWAHPATQASLSKLESWGIQILPVDSGHQACGEVGEGRLQDPTLILQATRQSLAQALGEMA